MSPVAAVCTVSSVAVGADVRYPETFRETHTTSLPCALSYYLSVLSVCLPDLLCAPCNSVQCHRTSGGMPTCEIFAVGPEVRAHMTLAVGEQLWSTAVVRVVDWVRDTVFSQEEAQQQQQQDGTGVGRGDRNSKISDGNPQHEGVLYRLHQISPAALLV